jgi:hypothetical protein
VENHQTQTCCERTKFIKTRIAEECVFCQSAKADSDDLRFPVQGSAFPAKIFINAEPLIRRRQRFRFLNLHFFIAADENAIARLSAKNLCATDFAFISFTQLTHGIFLLFFQFHWLAATGHSPVAAPSHNDFCPAFRTFIALACLIWHPISLQTKPYSSISLRSVAISSLGSVTD